MDIKVPANYSKLYTSWEISEAIASLTDRIDAPIRRTLEKYNKKSVVVLCVLKGATYFAVDFSRSLKIPHQLEFVQFRSYSENKQNKDKSMYINVDPNSKLRDQVVLLVDDIYDTGDTIGHLTGFLSDLNSVVIPVTLINCSKNRQNSVWSCFTHTTGEWLVGYGMDDKDSYRHLPDIYKVIDMKNLA